MPIGPDWDYDPRTGLDPNPHYDMQKSRMEGWIQTYTRDQVWPLCLTPDQIDLTDIAHALSMKVRFTGHCDKFYSVAEHSVRVMCECYQSHLPWRDQRLLLRTALMHDAAEYVLPDVAAPIKHKLQGFKELEQDVEAAIAKRFNLLWPRPAAIKVADNALVLKERLVLMKPNPHPWDVPGEPSSQNIACWAPETAKMMFLASAKDLEIE